MSLTSTLHCYSKLITEISIFISDWIYFYWHALREPNNLSLSTIDVDECSLRPRPCQDVCVNTRGSFFCQCTDPQLSLGPDRRRCVGRYRFLCNCVRYGRRKALPITVNVLFCSLLLVFRLWRRGTAQRDVKLTGKTTRGWGRKGTLFPLLSDSSLPPYFFPLCHFVLPLQSIIWMPVTS